MASGIRDIHLSRNALLAVVTLIGIVAIGLIVYLLIPSDDEEDQPQQQAQMSESQRPSPRVLDPHRGEAEAPDRAADPEQTRIVTNAAREFTDAWLRRDRGKSAWLGGIRQFATKGFTQQLELIDPQQVPAQQRTGEPKEVHNSELASTVEVPLDTGTLILRFNYADSEGLIASYDFERTPPP